ncbi:MAG: DUF302 domain-containing protein [bacterium]
MKGIDFTRYDILESCDPKNAHKAILAEEDIGLMLPCNVIIYEKGDGRVICIIKPTIAMGMIDNKELKQIAENVEAQLKRVFDSIQ